MYHYLILSLLAAASTKFTQQCWEFLWVYIPLDESKGKWAGGGLVTFSSL